MTTIQLKSLLMNLHLEKELLALLIELIDQAKIVDNQLLSTIREILDLQMELYLKKASLLIEEATIYNESAKKMTQSKTNEFDEKIARIKIIQKKLEKLIKNR